MTDQIDEYKQFILSADGRALMKQLKMDVKTPLVSAQNLVNVLLMLQNPSPATQKKIDSGELDAKEMLSQIGDLLTQALDVIDFYRQTLDEGQ
jgi:hypothetical protein